MAGYVGRGCHNVGVLFDRQMGARSISRQWRRGVGLWRSQFADHIAALDLLLVADFNFRSRVHPGLRHRIGSADRTRQACRPNRAKRSGTAAHSEALKALRSYAAMIPSHRISVISRLRLVTSSLRKIAWRCFFTVGELKQASSAISWLLRPSQTSRATSCSRLVSRARWGNRALAAMVRAAEERKSSHSIRKCGRATPTELSCFKRSVARKCGDRG